MTPKISIIAAVYNAEKYLTQCLASLAKQSLKNIEIICVDNNSTDNSPKIIKEFEKNYGNFRYIFKKGGMAGGARNEGIKHAKGDYILFADADDWLAENACEVLYGAIIQNKADIVSCAYTLTNAEGRPLKEVIQTEIPQTLMRPPAPRKEFFRVGAGIIGRPWGHLIKSSIIKENSLYFPEGRKAEDVPFMGALLAFSEHFIYLRKPLWFYRITPNSLGKSQQSLTAITDFKNYEYIRELLKNKNIYNEVSEETEYNLLKHTIGGEAKGNGSLKQSNKKQTLEFFAYCRNFYLNLPQNFFEKRNSVFKLKFALFKFALKHNLYFMPKAGRIITNPFFLIYRAFSKTAGFFDAVVRAKKV